MSTEPQISPDGNGHSPPGHSSQRISTESKPGTGRLLLIAGVLLALVLLVAFITAFIVRAHDENLAKAETESAADAKPIVEVVPVQPSANSYPLQLPGQTAGWYESSIFARVDGYVAKWSADIGDRVKQGQVLAVIDTPDLDQQLNAARAKAAASAAQVTVAESSVSIAKITNERWKDSPKGVVSEQEREEKKSTYEEAIARLEAAKAQNQLDQADVSRYSAMEGFKNITAPYDGIITARHIDIGDLINAGSASNKPAPYSICQSNIIRVFVDVPQKAAAEMIVDTPAQATSDEFPGRVFTGKIARSSMSIDPQSRTQKTEVDIPNADLALLPGMYVEVTFQLKQHGLQQVPAAAILFKPAGLAVAVVGDDNKVQFHPVTVARDNGDSVILASGVSPGDKVALNLSSAINPGEEVQVQQSSNDTAAPPAAPTPAPTMQTAAPEPGKTQADQPPVPASGDHPPAPAKAPGTDNP